MFLVVAGIIVYLVWNNYFRDKRNDNVDEQDTEIVEEKAEEDDVEVIDDSVDERESEKEKVTAYEGDSPNKAEDLTGVVTYAGVAPDGKELIIRVNIDQYLGEGSCELNLMRSGIAYSDMVGIVSSASTATCEGFNIPMSGLASGNYKIVVKISSGGKTGTINGEVNI